eukprot:CAMPEP_0198429356 /NCGR_PEP_ID=MMETSP1452-20131203/7125_1 /TAXON_ID=1181717 /ORGANISM="Synchroma pusillum, Strain CCMP3072" /LENGTH=34 /DNA_ID= /DNA_START= /DNA_END= /DNA_ORIENTATION=
MHSAGQVTAREHDDDGGYRAPVETGQHARSLVDL